MPDFRFFIDGEDENVFAVELDAKGRWAPSEEGVPGPKAFRILPNASFDRIPPEMFFQWFKMARRVTREEALKLASEKRPVSRELS